LYARNNGGSNLPVAPGAQQNEVHLDTQPTLPLQDVANVFNATNESQGFHRSGSSSSDDSRIVGGPSTMNIRDRFMPRANA
jgi:hypothetical protein